MPGYNLLWPVLSRMDPERAHRRTIALLKSASDSQYLNQSVTKLYRNKVPELPVELFGRRLSNPVGLAAGFDKNGVAYAGLAALGFGLVELGTVTPKAQPGNPGVRIFRLNEEQSIINRLGFNSDGLDAVLNNLARHSNSIRPAMLGINIGKNTGTPNDRAIDDYLLCLNAIYEHADYAVLNLSSPNSPGLRLLQQESEFNQLLHSILKQRNELADQHGGKVLPIAVKVSPDLEPGQIESIAEISLHHRIDALIATNTTTARAARVSHKHYNEAGGLSGRLLRDQATEVIRGLANATRGQIPILGVGGVSSAQDAWDKLLAGAAAVQLYSAMVFQGPAIVRKIATGLAELAEPYDSSDFSTAIELARQQI